MALCQAADFREQDAEAKESLLHLLTGMQVVAVHSAAVWPVAALHLVLRLRRLEAIHQAIQEDLAITVHAAQNCEVACVSLVIRSTGMYCNTTTIV